MGAPDVVERFLATGAVDPLFPGWPGSAMDRRREGTATLRDILRRVIARAAAHSPHWAHAVPRDAPERIRERIGPLVAGLFPEPDAAVLLDALPPRVVVLAPSGFGAVIETVPLRTAWDLANLLLDDLGAPPLADDVPELDGLCAAGRAFLLPRALEETRPDVVVHEVAHLLHSLRRGEVGLGPPTRPLLNVPPRRRETFAYACEVWTCRLRGLGGDDCPDEDARVDRAALAELLARATADPPRGWALLRAWAETPRSDPGG